MKHLKLLMLISFVGCTSLLAQENPYDGYSSTTSYKLDFVGGTSFSQTNAQDVQIAINLAGRTANFNVDTGSRGFFASSDYFGSDPLTYITNGQISLSSSGRLYLGAWNDTSLHFTASDGTDLAERAPVLQVSALGSGDKAASYDVSSGNPGYVILTNGDHVNIVAGSVTLQPGQVMTYADNPGVLLGVANFGIGFALTDTNSARQSNVPMQVNNPLLNLDVMNNKSISTGYIVKTDGIQLGLTTKDTNYAYTKLNPTGDLSSNGVATWQTPTGQTVINGQTNKAGSIVMDSGIGYSYLTATNFPQSQSNPPMAVLLINSGGLVGYNITSSTSNVLNPSFDYTADPSNNVIKSAPSSGTYSQNLPPFQDQYFNTGRNVFKDFNMLYDAQNGYIGILTNQFGATDTNVFFNSTAIASANGFFPAVVPEAASIWLFAVGGFCVLGYGVFQRGRPSQKGLPTPFW